MTLHDQDYSYQKHLRGKHDQRDHGRRQFGQAGGGSSSSGISTDNTTDIVTRARNESQNRNLARLSGFPDGARDKLDAIRDDLRTQRQSMIDARKAWRAAQKAGDDEAKTKAEKDFAQAFGNYEGLRRSYNEALQDFQAMNRLKGPEKNDRINQLKEKYQVTPLTIQPATPPKPATPPSWKNLPRLDPAATISVTTTFSNGVTITKDDTVRNLVQKRENRRIIRENRERAYNEYLDAVRDFQDPERGQYLPDGTYIPSQRAIRMARDIQRMIDDPNSELMRAPTAFSWDERKEGVQADIRLTQRAIRIPDGLTPFTEADAKGALRSPDLRKTTSTIANQLASIPATWPPSTKASKESQREWRDVLDFLGRFVTPTGGDGKPVNLFGNDNILAIATETTKGLLGSSATHGAVGVLKRSGISAYIDHLNATPGVITNANKHSRATTMIHETIHSLEDRNRNLRDRVGRFFQRRADGHYTIQGGQFGPGENFSGRYVVDTFEFVYTGRKYEVSLNGGGRASAGSELLTTISDGFSSIYRMRELQRQRADPKISAQQAQDLDDVISRLAPSLDTLRDTETLAFFLDVLSDPSSFN